MRTLKTFALAAILVLAMAQAALAFDVIVNNVANRRCWGVELFLQVNQSFNYSNLTMGSAMPVGWSIDVAQIDQGSTSRLFHVLALADLVSTPIDYLNNGTLISFNYTGSILGVDASTDFAVDDALGNPTNVNLYPSLLHVASLDANALAFQGPLGITGVYLLTPLP